MDSDTYQRAYERIKDYDLTTEEKQAIEKAKRQLNHHAIVGGVGLSLFTFFMGKRRGMNYVPLGLMTGAGMLVGAQLGFASGALAGVRTIKSLPNPERLVHLVQEVQTDMLAAKGLIVDSPRSPPRPMTSAEREQYQQKWKDRQSKLQNKERGDEFSDWQQQTSSYDPDNMDSAGSWDRIRKSSTSGQQEELPANFWNDKVSVSESKSIAAENEWMNNNERSATVKSTRNKWGDDVS